MRRTRQENRPNWFQAVSVYAPGSAKPVDEFDIEQVWDGTLRGHRRLRAAAVEQVEALRDKTGLHYLMWSPRLFGGRAIPPSERQHVAVD